MRRAERLFRLVDELRSRDVVRAEDLARTFECSLSTIYRDIAHLQGSGLPIEGEAGVGYVLRQGFDLPPVTFTHDQMDALAVGLSFVEQAGDPALAIAAREARAKLQAVLPDPSERALADAPFRTVRRQEVDALALVRSAIRARHVLRLKYANAQGVSSMREVEPLLIWALKDGWMFSGWCRVRKDFRTFRFDRISQLDQLPEQFAHDPDRGLRAFVALLDAHAAQLGG